MGIRATNMSDTDIMAAWFRALDYCDDPSLRVKRQGYKIKAGAKEWEPAVLYGPIWAIEMLKGKND